ncbi:MAG: hypothetical protein GY795_03175 [Desulfobacterales bacterium]|nr:hypothetical protein [Desulfobacterales bacterium]
MKNIFSWIVLIVLSAFIQANPAYGTATMKISPETVDLNAIADNRFDIEIIAENVTDMAAFEFEILYDPAVVSINNADDVRLGSFLGSTGRTVMATGPDIADGKLSYGAFTLGSTPGASGNGVLATVTLSVQSQVKTSLIFGKAEVFNSKGRTMPVTETGANITIKYMVTFTHGTGGTITGDSVQMVETGSSTTGVTAVPDTCYKFKGWNSDYTGTENPLVISNVVKEMEITADFLKCDAGDINCSGFVDLADAISALKVICGVAGNTTICADINGDEYVGLEEIVYIMRFITHM